MTTSHQSPVGVSHQTPSSGSGSGCDQINSGPGCCGSESPTLLRRPESLRLRLRHSRGGDNVNVGSNVVWMTLKSSSSVSRLTQGKYKKGLGVVRKIKHDISDCNDLKLKIEYINIHSFGKEFDFEIQKTRSKSLIVAKKSAFPAGFLFSFSNPFLSEPPFNEIDLKGPLN